MRSRPSALLAATRGEGREKKGSVGLRCMNEADAQGLQCWTCAEGDSAARCGVACECVGWVSAQW